MAEWRTGLPAGVDEGSPVARRGFFRWIDSRRGKRSDRPACARPVSSAARLPVLGAGYEVGKHLLVTCLFETVDLDRFPQQRVRNRLSPTVFAGRLPRHTLPPGFWSRGFHHASGTIRPSDYSQDTASHFACAYRVTSLGAARGS